LYVGFTRAREHLILAIPTSPKGAPRCAWLDELADADGPLLVLSPPKAPAKGGPNDTELAQHIELRVSTSEVSRIPARIWSIAHDAPRPTVTHSAERSWFREQTAGHERAPYAIHPSGESAESGLTAATMRVVFQTEWQHRMPFTRTKDVSWDQVGTALHAFLASDLPALTRQQREVRALRILNNAHLAQSFSVEALIAASDEWRRFVEQRWPGARWHREVPIAATVETPEGLRQIQGTVDLLLQTDSGVVLVDHKSFPGRVDKWATEALKYGPQLRAYTRTLQLAGHNVLGQFVHFTVGGGVVELA
jgi:ATP-dependent exoDNAse (exonuclease V) beta subunit